MIGSHSRTLPHTDEILWKLLPVDKDSRLSVGTNDHIHRLSSVSTLCFSHKPSSHYMSVADTISRLAAGLHLAGGSNQDEDNSLFDNTNFTNQSHAPQPSGAPMGAPKEEHEEVNFADAQLTLRALVSTKEAGIIIGKAGKNVAELRDSTGVKAGVSKVVPGVHDRVLTITGTLTAVTEAYTQIAQTFLENPLNNADSSNTMTLATLRLLVSHNLMGTIIGRQGAKIKMIQDFSGARMVASKEMLPQSTERIVELQGEIADIEKALWEVGKCLVEDWERGVGTVLYNPAVRLSPTSTVVAPTLANGVVPAQGAPGNYLRSHRAPRTGNPSLDFNGTEQVSGSSSNGEYKTQNISIPAEMVGCIIGKGGSKITEIRRSSGSKIAIAKDHDESNERLFTISGAPANNEKALFLIYQQLESEKARRQSSDE